MEQVRAISIVVYDPSGREPAGTTYPTGSVWMLDKERKTGRQEVHQEARPYETTTLCQLPERPSIETRTWDDGPFGITLDDLRAWDFDQLRNLAVRMQWPPVSADEAERFAVKLKSLLPRATGAGQIIEDAWRYSLQDVENTKPENAKIDENDARATHGVEVTRQGVPSSKSRVKRFRSRHKGWSPERMSIHQAVKARNRSGNHTCFVCGKVDTSPHHVIPRSEGGLPISDNIVWLCEPHHDQVEGPFAGPINAWDRICLAKAEYLPDGAYESTAA
jgi:hypothetical protein